VLQWDLTKRVWCVAGDKVHTFVSGCVPGQVAGTHILNEARIGGLAGDDLACLPGLAARLQGGSS
jgi:hypothetical protein